MNNFNKRLEKAIIISKLHEAMDASLAQAVRGRKINVDMRSIFIEYAQHHGVRLLLEQGQNDGIVNAQIVPAGNQVQTQTNQPTAQQQVAKAPPVQQSNQPATAQQQSSGKAPPAQGPATFDAYVKGVKTGMKGRLLRVTNGAIADLNKANLKDSVKRNYIKLISACYERLMAAVDGWAPRQYNQAQDKEVYAPKQSTRSELKI